MYLKETFAKTADKYLILDQKNNKKNVFVSFSCKLWGYLDKVMDGPEILATLNAYCGTKQIYNFSRDCFKYWKWTDIFLTFCGK